MKPKDIEYNAGDLVSSVEAFSRHVTGREKLTLRSSQLCLPPPIKAIKPKDIAAIRHRLCVSQTVFARLLNVPRITAISWEQGRRKPTGAALKLLDMARKKPALLQEV